MNVAQVVVVKVCILVSGRLNYNLNTGYSLYFGLVPFSAIHVFSVNQTVILLLHLLASLICQSWMALLLFLNPCPGLVRYLCCNLRSHFP